jgi:hypothetical protein
MLNRLLNLFVRPVSPDEFTAEMAAFISSADSNRKVETVEPLYLKVAVGTEDPSEVHLRNAYLEYLRDPRKRKFFIANFANSLLQAEVDSFIPKNIIPTIKDCQFVTEVRATLNAKGKNADDFFVTEPYNDCLAIVYAVDSPKSVRFLNPADLQEVNLHGEPLRSFALENLKAMLPPVQVEGNGPVLSLKAGGMFESSLILLDRVWDKRELGIQGEIVVAIPSRETLLVTGSESGAGMMQIQKAARSIASRSGYGITERLFIRRDATFVPL